MPPSICYALDCGLSSGDFRVDESTNPCDAPKVPPGCAGNCYPKTLGYSYCTVQVTYVRHSTTLRTIRQRPMGRLDSERPNMHRALRIILIALLVLPVARGRLHVPQPLRRKGAGGLSQPRAPKIQHSEQSSARRLLQFPFGTGALTAGAQATAQTPSGKTMRNPANPAVAKILATVAPVKGSN